MVPTIIRRERLAGPGRPDSLLTRGFHSCSRNEHVAGIELIPIAGTRSRLLKRPEALREAQPLHARSG
jgi:hypothetical protein